MIRLKKLPHFISLFLCLLTVIPVTAQQKRPNIILIMADDMGYSDIGCYGGEIHTPNIDRLASEGIRFRQFYNGARCCPTRASLMTGLYAHQAGMGWMVVADMGRPAYQGNLNNTSVTIAEVLKAAGYDTYMTGKWHLTNERKIEGNVIDNWPKQRGFNHYFGIIPGGANYFTPTIYSDNKRYKAPDSFYLTNAISDTSVGYIEEHFDKHPDKPMFMYVAYTSPHWPLQALQKDIAKYTDYYQKGWDSIRSERFARQKELKLFKKNTILSPRDSAVQAWKDVPKDKQTEMVKRMAIYAAQVDIMDQGIGRIIAKLKEEHQLDNTLIFFLSDNGACAEFISSGQTKEVNGKQNSFESYRINWANVSSTPFKEYKHFTYEGGIATPLIVHWPNGIAKSLNNTFAKGYGHITDIMATCIDVAQANYPAKYHGHTITPLEGQSLAAVFTGDSVIHHTTYWEHEANIAMRDGKWKLVASTPENKTFDTKTLRLYNLEEDPTEMNDLAKKFPERVQSMYNQWHDWGERVKVFPMDTRPYGVRKQAYQRIINGNFDDLLGGWKVRKKAGVEATVMIDTSGSMTGRNALKVKMLRPAKRPNGLSVQWPFKAKKGEQFEINLDARADRHARMYVRLEAMNGKFSKVIDQPFNISTQSSTGDFKSISIPENGNYRIALYFGDMAKGTNVWVDNIKFRKTGQ
ncbi:arylsulfatase [Arachidicoccus terrestris]|uniref:arylsulfatase n=1 Tax=Arachidicoccus terrestris TaxID=2875539 RepID=UPI001CC6B75C|nr:arylsulfatase [Arachidicoccus terrestris]UAY56895.1 arylsulfatase [Arachidicoccus terrestris]